VNLGDELSGRSEDEGGRVGLSRSRELGVGVGSVGRGRGRRSRSVGEGSGEDGEEETSSLSRTGLGASHEVSSTGDDGDGVLLDGSRSGVSSVLNVLEEDGIHGSLEFGDGLRDVSTGSLDGNGLVFVEVDSSVL